MSRINYGYRRLPCIILAMAAFMSGSPPALAGEVGAADAKAMVQECSSRSVVAIAIKPDITASSIKSLAGHGKREVIYTTASDDVTTAITAMIDAKKREALRVRWDVLRDATKSFDEWLAEQTAGVAQQVEKDIAAAINAAQDALPAQIDQLCTSLADGMNKAFAVDVTVAATYKYVCNQFDPGNPGWAAAELHLPRHDVVKAKVPMGFAIEIPLQINGVEIGKLPVVARGEVSASAWLTGFHGLPKSWQPTRQHPKVTSSFKVNARWAVKWKATEGKLVELTFGEACSEFGIGGNVSIPDDRISFELIAKNERHVAR